MPEKRSKHELKQRDSDHKKTLLLREIVYHSLLLRILCRLFLLLFLPLNFLSYSVRLHLKSKQTIYKRTRNLEMRVQIISKTREMAT